MGRGWGRADGGWGALLCGTQGMTLSNGLWGEDPSHPLGTGAVWSEEGVVLRGVGVQGGQRAMPRGYPLPVWLRGPDKWL